MRLLIVGAGATGGYFGGRLAQAGIQTPLLTAADAQSLRLSEPTDSVIMEAHRSSRLVSDF